MSETEPSLKEQLAERMRARYSVSEEQPVDQTPVEGAPATEEQTAEEAAPQGLKGALVARGIDVSEIDEEQLAEQLAEQIKSRDAQVRENAELRRQLEELRQLASQQKPTEVVQEEKPVVKPEQSADAIRRWTKVEIDESLYSYADEKNGRFVAKEGTGSAGIEAARKLNEVAKERSRRAELLMNDPIGALEEAGFGSLVEERVQAKIADIEKRLDEKLTRKEQEELEKQKALLVQQQHEEQERSFREFMAAREAEFFKLDGKGAKVVSPVTGDPVLTEAGKRAREIALEVMKDEGFTQDQFPVALRMAVRVLDAEKKAKPVEPSREEKKQAFLDKGKAETKPRTSVAQVAERNTVSSGRLRLSDMVLTDPRNAELLENYRGN